MTDLPRVLLVPVDGSKNACAAAAYAAAIAAKLGVPVRLLFAFPKSPVDLYGFPTEGHDIERLKHFTAENFERLRSDAAGRAFEAARRAIGDTSVKLEETILGGDAGQAILQHAVKVPGALIVIGRRGLSRFKELVMGSTTQRVLHHSKCPVLVVH
jgi:nucleotide-binding universal stress UspA family protein